MTKQQNEKEEIKPEHFPVTPEFYSFFTCMDAIFWLSDSFLKNVIWGPLEFNVVFKNNSGMKDCKHKIELDYGKLHIPGQVFRLDFTVKSLKDSDHSNHTYTHKSGEE